MYYNSSFFGVVCWTLPRWWLEPERRLHLHHDRVQLLRIAGAVRLVPLPGCHTWDAQAVRPRTQVLHRQVRHFPLILARYVKAHVSKFFNSIQFKCYLASVSVDYFANVKFGKDTVFIWRQFVWLMLLIIIILLFWPSIKKRMDYSYLSNK
jgi:hypothetical protein